MHQAAAVSRSMTTTLGEKLLLMLACTYIKRWWVSSTPADYMCRITTLTQSGPELQVVVGRTGDQTLTNEAGEVTR